MNDPAILRERAALVEHYRALARISAQTLPALLRGYRGARGLLSLAAMAREIGVTRSFLHHAENGRRPVSDCVVRALMALKSGNISWETC